MSLNFTCCAGEDMRSVLPPLKLEAALDGRDNDNLVVSALWTPTLSTTDFLATIR